MLARVLVLVAEDDAVVRDVVGRYLTEAGYRVAHRPGAWRTMAGPLLATTTGGRMRPSQPRNSSAASPTPPA